MKIAVRNEKMATEVQNLLSKMRKLVLILLENRPFCCRNQLIMVLLDL